MILTAKTIVSAIRPPYPYGEELVWQFLFVLKLSWFPLLISTFALCLGAPGPAGGRGALAVRRARPARRLLRPHRDPLDRPAGHRRRRRRRRRHRDHRRPRRPQDPRGARRPAGARRRPGQEPGRAALPGPDGDHRPARHLRDRLRPLRRHRRRAALQAVARRLLRHPLLQRHGHRHLGLGADVHDVRRDHRRRLLLQGDDRLGRRRGRRPRRQPGGGDRPRRGLLLPLRLHLDPARHQPRTAERSDDRLARRPARLARLLRRDRPLRLARRRPRLSAAACCASSARACARPGS